MEQVQQHKQGSEMYQSHVEAAEALRSEAWSAFNSAFHAPEAEEYRQAGRDLYRRVIAEQIQALYARGDEQNRILDEHNKA